MNVKTFIDNKTKQLVFFVKGFWSRQIPHAEVELFFWDTLEEWAQVEARENEPITQKERVFWHMLHQMHYWSETKLMQDPFLRSELTTCLDYLEGEGSYPLDCIGIRP